MSHLIPPSIKPHLRRSRSHTSPSPSRPTTFLSPEPTPSAGSRSGNKDNGTDVQPLQTQTSASNRVTPRASSDVQRHSHLPRLHLHTALSGNHGQNSHQLQKQGSENQSAATIDKTVPDVRPDSSDKQGISSMTASTSHITSPRPLQQRNTLNTPDTSSLRLRRTLSHRSSRVNGSLDKNTLSPATLGGTIGGAWALGSALPTQTRPRATSDSTSGGVRQEPTAISAAQTQAYNEIALDLERAEQRRQTELKNVTPSDVLRLRQKTVEAESEMRRRLDGVTKEGLDITRRLDYTYYSLLEKVGGLTAVINQLSNLRAQTIELGDQIEKEVKTVDEEIRSSIATLRNAAEGRRMERVERLEIHMRNGRERAKALGDRLEAARVKLSKHEKSKDEYRRRIGRRLKMVWMSVCILLLLLIVLLGIRAQVKTQTALDEMGLGAKLGPEARRSVIADDRWVEEIRQARAGFPRRGGNDINRTKQSSGRPKRTTAAEKELLEQRLQEVYVPEDVVQIITANSEEVKEGRSSKSTSKPPSFDNNQQPPQSVVSATQKAAVEERLRIFDEL